MYGKLKAYKTEHGDCLVPARYKKDPQLGTWVKNHRQEYRKGQLKKQDRIDKLNSIGFVWNLTGS